MARTDMFQQQHSEMAEIVTAISGRLDTATLANEAREVVSLLAQLGGKLKMHLAAEDKSLYPAMFSSSNSEASQAAKKFMDEMGGLKGAFDQYSSKWRSYVAVQNDPAGFATETKSIFAALKDRVQREDKELYPLADKI